MNDEQTNFKKILGGLLQNNIILQISLCIKILYKFIDLEN